MGLGDIHKASYDGDMLKLANEVIYELPNASLNELLKEAMKRNHGSMHPEEMLATIKSALMLERDAFRETVNRMTTTIDARMETSRDEFLKRLEAKANEIDRKLNEHDRRMS